jgi:hypothetical protein
MLPSFLITWVNYFFIWTTVIIFWSLILYTGSYISDATSQSFCVFRDRVFLCIFSKISDTVATRIIRTSFTCLRKIIMQHTLIWFFIKLRRLARLTPVTSVTTFAAVKWSCPRQPNQNGPNILWELLSQTVGYKLTTKSTNCKDGSNDLSNKVP